VIAHFSNAILTNIYVTNHNNSSLEIRDSSSAVLTNIVICGNNISGLTVTNSSIVLTNATIACNNGLIDSLGHQIVRGTGIVIGFNSVADVRNSIIWGNGRDIIVGNNFYDSSAISYSHSLVGGEAVGNGILFNCDPLFVDTSQGDYRLQCRSPAINAGSNAHFSKDSLPDLSHIVTDMDGLPRFYNNGIVDMGAYEFQQERFSLSLPDSLGVCGFPVEISANSPGMHYLWSTGDTTESSLVFSGGSYSVAVTDRKCTIEDTMEVYPLLDLMLEDTLTLCDSSLLLTAHTVGTGLRYLWSTGDTTANSIVYAPGVYWVEVYKDSCVIRDSITVLPSIRPNWEDSIFVCGSDTILFVPSDKGTFLWNTGETGNSIRVLSSGTYWVASTYKECTINDTVYVSLVDISGLEMYTAGSLCEEGSAELSSNKEDLNYQWSTGATTPTIHVSKEGVYTLLVFQRDCKAEQTTEIVCPCELSLPNFFTPNKDGYNDSYLPEIKFSVNNFSMFIYDRWGRLIYKTDSFIPWDGTYHGEAAEAGVYYCVASYTCSDSPDKQRTVQSSITLMR
jgi:gliding motility-associated-like protein